MYVRVLGSAAGGGLPQWNCGCAQCADARTDSSNRLAQTQSSLAVSESGIDWLLVNASPDVRQQVQAFPPLGPSPGRRRHTGIGACVLTDAELDHVLGLFILREGADFPIYSTPAVARVLDEVLSLSTVLATFGPRRWVPLSLRSPTRLPWSEDTGGLTVETIDLGGCWPRFARGHGEAEGAVVGLLISDGSGRRLLYAPCVSQWTAALRAAAQEAALVFMDGTFWSDNEMIDQGLGDRSATAMGHLPVSGPGGSLEQLRELQRCHRIYVHVNNSNPMLRRDSSQRREVESAGIRIAADGDCFQL